MKLRSIWVESFGSLKHMSVPINGNLTPGLNVLFGPNEAGKSQLKGFLEQLMFPRANQRTPKEHRSFGRVSFVHEGNEYSLDALASGSSARRRLYRDSELVEGDLSNLFPSLKGNGHEVFSNLYSFGLDQLFAGATSGSGVLSEHLFGAIAGGRGMSISSVFDELDIEIRRLTGRDARYRSLQKVLDDLEEAETRRNESVAEQRDFIEKFRDRGLLGTKIAELQDDYDKAAHELSVMKEVRRMTDEYYDYVRAKEYLDDHTNLVEMDHETLRRLETDQSEASSLSSSIAEFQTKKQEAAAMLQPLLREGSLVGQRNEVRAIQLILEDVVELRAQLIAGRTHLAADLSAVEASASAYAIDSRRMLENGAELELRPALETLENVRGNLDSLQRQRGDYLSSPLLAASTSEIEQRQEVITASVEKVNSLLEGAGNATGGFVKRAYWHWPVSAAVIAILVVGVLRMGRVLNSPSQVLSGLAVAAMAVALIAVISQRATRGDPMAGSQELLGIREELNLSNIESRTLTGKLEELQNEKRRLDSIFKERAELSRISQLLEPYRIEVGPSVPLEYAKENVSRAIEVLREVVEISRINADLSKVQARLSQRTIDLESALRSSFPELELQEAPSIDLLSVVVSDLSERLASSIELASKAEALEGQIATFDGEVARLSEELERVRARAAAALEKFGFFDVVLDEGLLGDLRAYLERKNAVALFVRSIESVFGKRDDEILPHFELGTIGIEESVQDLDNQVKELQQQRDALLLSQADIDGEERRLLSKNSVAEDQAIISALSAEASELLGRVRVALLARQMLRNANARFEDLHQPELLKLSSEMFARITQGRYVSILKKELEKGDFIFARSSSGEDVADQLLSRGTREQLYIAIRLALVTRPNALDLPLLMDDVMVNADIQRAEGIARELESVSECRQVLYFCAKPDALKLFDSIGAKTNVVEMSRL